jgi:hypothetical protein
MENIVDRTYQRVSINKGLSYNGLDVHSRVVDRYMGVALNISQNGIQLETDLMITTELILLMFFDYNSQYIATKGKVVYSNKDKSGKFKTGIQLQGTKEENLQFVKKLLKTYHYLKRVPIFVGIRRPRLIAGFHVLIKYIKMFNRLLASDVRQLAHS